MATRAETLSLMNGFHVDNDDNVINLGSDVFSMRLTSTVIAITDLTSAALTEVVGSNYTAGGILVSLTKSTVAGKTTYQSAVDIKWLDHVSGFTDAYMCVLYDDTASRIIAISDIRDGTTVVSNQGQDVDLNAENGTDLFSTGV